MNKGRTEEQKIVFWSLKFSVILKLPSGSKKSFSKLYKYLVLEPGVQASIWYFLFAMRLIIAEISAIK